MGHTQRRCPNLHGIERWISGVATQEQGAYGILPASTNDSPNGFLANAASAGLFGMQ